MRTAFLWISVPVQINLGSSDAVSAYQIETTEGYCEDALEISFPKVMPLAGIANDNKAEMNMPSAINFTLTSQAYCTWFFYISCE